MTDVTGFGLLGHGLEMARGSGVTLAIRGDAPPLLAQAETLAEQGFVTGASHRNWDSYGDAVVLPSDLPLWRRHLLTDPQTSGGLLIACAADEADGMVARIAAAGYRSARRIGTVSAGPPQVRIEL